MFAFLLKLRHPANAISYARNLAMLELTLNSILGQRTSYPFIIAVVCNVKPELSVKDSRIHYVLVDFQESGSRVASAQRQYDCWLDKGAKVAMGLHYLRAYNVSRVFLMDADDWVHRDTVETIMSRSEIGNWYADRGYLVDFHNQRTVRKRGLVRYCGSSLILDFDRLLDLVGLPEELAEDGSRDELLSKMGEFALVYILGHHRYYLGMFAARGELMSPIPIPVCCWVVNTGENRSGTSGPKYGRAFDSEFLASFSLDSQFRPPKAMSSRMSRLYESLLLSRSAIGWLISSKTSEKV